MMANSSSSTATNPGRALGKLPLIGRIRKKFTFRGGILRQKHTLAALSSSVQSDSPLNRIRDPQLGWGRLALGGVEMHTVAGDHLTSLQEPYVRELAEELKKCLLTDQPQEALLKTRGIE
jgi:thioesterase domain-containing protein